MNAAPTSNKHDYDFVLVFAVSYCDVHLCANIMRIRSVEVAENNCGLHLLTVQFLQSFKTEKVPTIP